MEIDIRIRKIIIWIGIAVVVVPLVYLLLDTFCDHLSRHIFSAAQRFLEKGGSIDTKKLVRYQNFRKVWSAFSLISGLVTSFSVYYIWLFKHENNANIGLQVDAAARHD